MNSIATTPGALRILAGSVVARLPLTMIGIGLLVHVQHLTGSFGDAGIVDGAYGLALGVGGPPLGRLADRRGQTGVLVATSVASAVLLVGLAALPIGAPLLCQVALAALLGSVTPPVGACLRALLPDVLSDADALHASFAVDATAVELTWVVGPPLALALGSAVSSGFALAAIGFVILAATAAFAAEPASRSWRPAAGGLAARGGALRSPALRVLVAALVGVGVLFGAVEVGIAAAAKELGSTASAGPILALWGGGSLLGGAVAARLGGGARTPAGLALVLAALAGAHLLLVPAAGSVLAIGAVVVLGGAAIAPTYAAVYAMADRAAPTGTVTEAFAWLATAVAFGAAAGSGLAGAVVDATGPVGAFALGGGAGVLATLVVVVCASSIPAPESMPLSRQAGYSTR
jgi:predicted MFS family arabinose efflux permease